MPETAPTPIPDQREPGGTASIVAALERLWTAVRNYGHEHGATTDAAHHASTTLADLGGGELLTLRVGQHCFISARDSSDAAPSELARRLYDVDVAALAIATGEVTPAALVHLVRELGCRGVEEARLRVDAIIAENSLAGITLLRMRFDVLNTATDAAGTDAWEQLTVQLLNPGARGFDASAMAGAIAQAVESGAAGAARDVLSRIAARAREAAGAEASAAVGRLRAALASLNPETRSKLIDVSGSLEENELERLAQFVDVMPLRDGIVCLQNLDLSDGAAAAAGVRMVQRMSRVAGHEAQTMQELEAIAKRWATTAAPRSTYAESLEQVGRLMRASQSHDFNPEEYDRRLATIAASLEVQNEDDSCDEAEALSAHLMLGIELLASPEQWGEERGSVLQELSQALADASAWDDPALMVALIERLMTVAATPQCGQARVDAGEMLERLVVSPSAVALFETAGEVQEVARALAALCSSGVPASVDLLAQLRLANVSSDTESLIDSCIARMDERIIRDRIVQSLEHGSATLAQQLGLAERLSSDEVHAIIAASIEHPDAEVRAAALQVAQRCTGEIPHEWIHAGMRDSSHEVRRATVAMLAKRKDDMAAELLTLHVLGDIASVSACGGELAEAVEAIGAARSGLANRCLATIVGRAFANPGYIRSGAPTLAAKALRGRSLGLGQRITLMLWSVLPFRLVIKPFSPKEPVD